MVPDFTFNPITIEGSSVINNNGTFQIESVISPTSVTIYNPVAQTDTGGDSWSFGPIPTQTFLTWETYNYLENDTATATYVRQWNELPSIPANVTCQVSFNGGITYNPVLDSEVFSVPIPDQGSQFIIRLTNTSPSRLSIGSWLVVY
jgi:hypothetical protein